MRKRHPAYGRDHTHETPRREPEPEAEHCPACGELLPESDHGPPCMCPWCGTRVCEGQV